MKNRRRSERTLADVGFRDTTAFTHRVEDTSLTEEVERSVEFSDLSLIHNENSVGIDDSS